MNTYQGRGRRRIKSLTVYHREFVKKELDEPSAGTTGRGYKSKGRERGYYTDFGDAYIESEDDLSTDETTDQLEHMDWHNYSELRSNMPRRRNYMSSISNRANSISKENEYFTENENAGSDDFEFSEESVFKFLVKTTGGLSSVSKFKEEYLNLPGNFTEWLLERKERLAVYKREQNPMCIGPFLRNATLCFHHTGIGREKECNRGSCCHFHICKFYLNGFCKNGYKCRKEHDFTNGHNTKIKEKLGLQDFNDEEIKVILLCRYPQVCRARTCMAGEDCPYLHICYNFIANRCVDTDCKRGHSFETPHNRWVLSVYKMERWPREKSFLLKSLINMPRKQLCVTYLSQYPPIHPMLENIKCKEVVSPSYEVKMITQQSEKEQVASRRYWGNLEVPSRENSSSRRLNEVFSDQAASNSVLDMNADKQNICLSGLTRGCQERSCNKHHTRLPYLWQIFIYRDWVSFDDKENQKLEQSYCNKEDSADGEVNILQNTQRITLHFNKKYGVIDMAGNSVKIPYRRLTTVSYAEENIPLKTGSFHTQWRWYVKNDYGQWMQYETDLLQYTLEKKYLTGQKSYLFTRESHTLKYRLEFAEWKQTNIGTNKVRMIQRRPVFVSLAEVQSRQFPGLLDVAIPDPYPSEWDSLDLAHDFEWIDLEKTCVEFKSVKTEFYTTLRKERFQICNIYRIQNLGLWNEYKMKRANLERVQSRKTGSIDEKSLFHGTDSFDTCYGICTNNFDFRLSGKNATVYGKGSYFAVSAKYSNNYTKGPVRLMFKAKVLIGHYTKGKHEMTCPPVIPGEGHKRYDSCVDDVTNPSIYVVFDRNQCYPEYLIAYKEIPEDMPIFVSNKQANTSTIPKVNISAPATTSGHFSSIRRHSPAIQSTSRIHSGGVSNIPAISQATGGSTIPKVNMSVPATTSGHFNSIRGHSPAIQTTSRIHSGGVSNIPASSQATGGSSLPSLPSSVGSSNPTSGQTSSLTSQRYSSMNSTLMRSSSPAPPNFSKVFSDSDKVYNNQSTSSRQFSRQNATPSSNFRSLSDRNRKKTTCTLQ